MAKIKFGKPEITCVSLEKALGLKRGDILSMSIANGEVDIDFKDTVLIPDAVLEAKIEKLLGLTKKGVL